MWVVNAVSPVAEDFAEALVHATLEAYERYAVEVVERFNFCPWARSARESDNVTLRVVFSVDHDDFDESLRCLHDLHEQAPDTDIALFIYPLLDLDRLGFEDYARRLRTRAETGQKNLDAFAMAAFHPTAGADLTHPDRLVPFVRRSPDPTLQLVRKSALSGIKGLTSGTAFLDVSALTPAAIEALLHPAQAAQPPPKPVRERIAEQNLASVRDAGTEAIEAVLTDIARQREAAHERLLTRYGRRGPQRLIPG
jgi:hypothetical protein